MEFYCIPSYEGMYEINKNGDVRSIARAIKTKHNKTWNYQSKIIKPRLTPNGYYQVRLSCAGKVDTLYVHRLVATTFLDKSNTHDVVCHKNDIKTDNRVENLFWATQKINIQDMITKGRAWTWNPKYEVVLTNEQIQEVEMIVFHLQKLLQQNKNNNPNTQ